MPTDEETKNLAIVTEYFTEYWGKANPTIVDTHCADDFVLNYPMHGPRHGRDAAKRMLTDLKQAKPPTHPIPSTTTTLTHAGLPRPLLPRIPAPPHRERAVRRRPLDRRRHAHRRRVWRPARRGAGRGQYGEADALFWDNDIHVAGGEDCGRDGRGGRADGAAGVGARAGAECGEGG